MKQHGFTLIELMIVLSLSIILSSMALPFLSSFVQNNQSIADTNLLVSSLHLARSEAVKRGRAVVVCASADQITCSTNLDWTTGWMVFDDTDGNSNFTVGETVLKVFSLNSQNMLLGDVDRIEYRSVGSTVVAGNFTMFPPDCDDSYARLIRVQNTGLVNSNKFVCAGVPQ